MKTAKQLHEHRIAKVQALLDLLIVTAKGHNLSSKGDMMLTSLTDEGGIVEMTIQPSSEKTFFMCLAWIRIIRGERDFLKLQYHADTGLVDDSSSFDDAGESTGGLIQIWHAHDRDLDLFLYTVQKFVQEETGKWILGPYEDAIFLRS